MAGDLRSEAVEGIEAVMIARRMPVAVGIVLCIWLFAIALLGWFRPHRIGGLPVLGAIEVILLTGMLIGSRYRKFSPNQRLNSACAGFVALAALSTGYAMIDRDPLESVAAVQFFFALLALVLLPFGPIRQTILAIVALAGTVLATVAGVPRLLPPGFIVPTIACGLGLTVAGQALGRHLRQDLLAKQSALLRASAELVAKNRRGSATFMTISHEFRTPCHILLGYVDLILDGSAGPLDPDQRQLLERIRDNGRRLSLLITDALDALPRET